MRVLLNLRCDHRLILGALGELEAAAELLALGVDVPKRPVEASLDFLHIFGEQLHLAKEEEVLFPRLEAMKIPSCEIVVAELLAEHDHGRDWLRVLARTWPTRRSAGGARSWSSLAQSYGLAMRAHAEREDALLLRLAGAAIDDERAAELEAAARRFCQGFSAAFYKRVDALSRELSGVGSLTASAKREGLRSSGAVEDAASSPGDQPGPVIDRCGLKLPGR